MIPGASRVYAADLAVALSLAGNGQICLCTYRISRNKPI